jgi:glycosyltransferase involved in cell wall biosynthesis
MKKIIFFIRKPGINWSIERVYDDIFKKISKEFRVEFYKCRFISQGFFKRLYDTLYASLHQGDINHITGDIHFLTYFLQSHKTIITIQDCGGLHRLKGIKRFLYWFFWIWLPIKRCRLIITSSKFIKKELLLNMSVEPRKIKIIHHPVSNFFQQSRKVFNTKCPRILSIGQEANKNLERHLLALKDLDCEFILITTNPNKFSNYLKKIKIKYSIYSNLSNLDLFKQYQLCDFLLFASLYEGFGLPIIEAQAVGRAVITSNFGSMKEVAGEAACLVDPYNVKHIRSGIDKIILNKDYRDNLIKKGYENVKRFNINKISKKHTELYRKILNNKLY